jgi:hypothetical protein
MIEARRTYRRIIPLQHASRSGPERVAGVYTSITDHYCSASKQSPLTIPSTILSDKSGRLWTSDVMEFLIISGVAVVRLP